MIYYVDEISTAFFMVILSNEKLFKQLCIAWHIQNDMLEPVFRIYSQDCVTSVGLDTLGTSVAEGVPDILNASGLCSYRSWFEKKGMAQMNG